LKFELGFFHIPTLQSPFNFFLPNKSQLIEIELPNKPSLVQENPGWLHDISLQLMVLVTLLLTQRLNQNLILMSF